MAAAQSRNDRDEFTTVEIQNGKGTSESTLDNDSGAHQVLTELLSYRFWSNAASKVRKALLVADEHLAEWFGLNESKYQWAIDSFLEDQLIVEEKRKIDSSVDMQPMPVMREQVMKREDIAV